MTIISLLRDIKELETVKIKQLPIPYSKEFCKDHKWARNEFNKWSKQFSSHNPRAESITADFPCISYIKCDSKERLLKLIKFFSFIVYIDEYILPARKERSAPKMEELFKALLTAMKTGRCDQGFVIGERLVKGLTLLKAEMNDEQFNILEKYLEEGFRAHIDIHCNFWLKDKVIPLKDYVYIRERESFWILLTSILAEYSVGFEMSSDIRSNKLIKEFTAKCSELGLAIDDYCVAKMKIMTNDMTSRIICLLNERKCTLQEAFDNQFEYTMDLYKECTDLKDKINENSEIASEQLSHWMEASLDQCYQYFQFVVILLDIEVNEDQTLGSAKWDQVYNELQSNAKQRVDPFFFH